MAMLVRYLASVDYAGLALTWNERSIVIQSVETLDPSLLDGVAASLGRRRPRARSRARTCAADRLGPGLWTL